MTTIMDLINRRVTAINIQSASQIRSDSGLGTGMYETIITIEFENGMKLTINPNNVIMEK